MSLADYTIEFEELLSLLSRKIWDKTSSYYTSILISSQCKLTEVHHTIAMTTMSDYTYDNKVQQVKAVYCKNKQEQSEEKI